MIFAFALLIVAVSCDVAHLKSNRGANGYNYPKPEGERLELPNIDNDYLPPSKDESVPEAPVVPEEVTTTTTAAPSIPSNEYLPAADPITNDYLPPSAPSADEPICTGNECEEQIITTAANEVIV